MMTSFVDNIPPIIKAIVELRPKNILDIGSAFGKYGLMTREALLSVQAEETGEIHPEPDFRLVACENSPYFIAKNLLPAIYDEVCTKNALDLSSEELSQFDLILLIDVIEHWSKEDYLNFVKKIPVSTKVLISTPKEVCFYDKHYYDCPPHITQFTAWDFDGYKDLSTKDSLIYLI